MKKRYFLIGDFSRNVLLVSAAACLGLTSCSDNRSAQNEASTEWNAGESAPQYSQGVITEMTEVSPDNWKITDERPAGAGQVMAILKHNDGKVDTLQGLELERRMQEYTQANPHNGTGFSMMNVLMWSGIGYMAGRMLSPNPAYYANPNTIQRNEAWRQQTTAERSRGAQAFRNTTGTYSRPATSSGNVRSTRPTNSRSGTFGGRSGGFGG
ncbi:hypothetical protein EFA69_12945 [Rufibacter immobilis]|uniref:UPF0323 domain-containing protein n=1 Tax=Rufibacter immobilis TaxID=1348778 RepID=A0A3M9MNJ7_9BACT|nr:hypothetical protein [Rufibacter immobilis]RNI27081.1 hypothetical protein EFA69_12945 [Rufibacter immobilis]